VANKEKRWWCYTQYPRVYSIAPHKCGNNGVWSEFKHHLWCARCKVDFVPKHWGIFDGPIPIGLCGLLGIRFDRYIIETGEVFRDEEITAVLEQQQTGVTDEEMLKLLRKARNK
jgi:hypothetical protein